MHLNFDVVFTTKNQTPLIRDEWRALMNQAEMKLIYGSPKNVNAAKHPLRGAKIFFMRPTGGAPRKRGDHRLIAEYPCRGTDDGLSGSPVRCRLFASLAVAANQGPHRPRSVEP